MSLSTGIVILIVVIIWAICAQVQINRSKP